jgi:hypothetical protein
VSLLSGITEIRNIFDPRSLTGLAPRTFCGIVPVFCCIGCGIERNVVVIQVLKAIIYANERKRRHSNQPDTNVAWVRHCCVFF